MKLSFNRTVVSIIIIGLILRLIFIFFFNYTFDFFNILALVKSVVDTGDLTAGWVALKRSGLEVQLYGKIYYQIAALWVNFASRFTHLLDADYLQYLFRTAPALYQVVIIKLVQLFYDAVFVFFLYKTAKLLEVKKPHYILIFWALNPFFLLVPYAWFQSDFAMITALTGGVYFWMASLKKNEKQAITANKVLSLILLSAGAVIKQVPLLFIPFAIVSFSRNRRSFLAAITIATVSYFLIGQPWAADNTLLKQMLFNSKESTAIFNFQLNSMSVFLFSYITIFLLAFFQRRHIITNIKNIVYLSLLIIIVIYITEDSTLFFPQFVIWIMPFLGLFYLFEENYGWFFLVPVTGFLKRLMMDAEVLSGALKPSIGYGYNSLISFGQLFHSVFNPNLVGLVMTTAMVTLYILMAIIIFIKMFNVKINLNDADFGVFRTSLKQVSVYMLVIYLALFTADFILKSRYTVLPMKSLQRQTNQIRLGSTPLVVGINNPSGQTINAVEVRMTREEIKQPDYTFFRFTDGQNQVILEQKVNDYLFPVTEDNIVIPLSKPVKGQNLTMEIFKETDTNVVKLIGAKFIPAVTGGWVYDQPDTNALLQLDFKDDNIFEIVLRGQYRLAQIIEGVKFHLQANPGFFTGYFSLMAILILSLLLLNLPWKKNTSAL